MIALRRLAFVPFLLAAGALAPQRPLTAHDPEFIPQAETPGPWTTSEAVAAMQEKLSWTPSTPPAWEANENARVFRQAGETLEFGAPAWASGESVRTGHALPAASPEGARYDFGDWTEEYLSRSDGIEQLFVLRAEVRGDSQIRIPFRSSLSPRVRSTDRIDFERDGRPILRYEHAVVFDASGRRSAIPIGLEPDALILAVPGEWLADAVFPVTVDPLVGAAIDVQNPIAPPGNGFYWRSQVADVAASSVTGDYMVVWFTADGWDGAADPVYARPFDDTGAPQAAASTVQNTALLTHSPRIAYSSTAGNYMVVWTEDPDGSGAAPERAAGRIISETGAPVGASFVVSDDADAVYLVDVAFNGTNYVTAISHNTDAVGVRVRFFTTAGVAVGASTMASVGTDIGNSWGAVASLPATGVSLVLWGGGAAQWELKGRLVPNAGPMGPVTTYNTAPDWDLRPDVTADTLKNEFYAVWQDWRVNFMDLGADLTPCNADDQFLEFCGDLWVCRINSAGALQGTTLEITTDETDGWPHIAWSNDGFRPYVAWSRSALNMCDPVTASGGVSFEMGGGRLDPFSLALTDEVTPGPDFAFYGSAAASPVACEALTGFYSNPGGALPEDTIQARRYEFQAPPDPAITVLPSALNWTVNTCDPIPGPQSVVVTNSGPAGSSLEWFAWETATWITAAPTTGTLASGANATVTISVDQTGLPAGVYSAPVTFYGTCATNDPATVTITLTVMNASRVDLDLTSPPPGTAGESVPLEFIHYAGCGGPIPQTVYLSNTGCVGSTLMWTAVPNAPWMAATPSTGNLLVGPVVSLDVRVNPMLLTPGATLWNFDTGLQGWTVASTSGTVAWAADATPATVGGVDVSQVSTPSSLNYNDDTDYDDGVGPDNGTASSPAGGVNLAGMTFPLLSLDCDYQTDTTGTVTDQRWVEVSNDNFGTFLIQDQLSSTGTPLGGACSSMGLWHTHYYVLDPAWGAVRVRVRFNTINAAANNLAGWFVDNVVIADGDDLPTGSYAGSIKITDPGAVNNPQWIYITLKVREPPEITVTPTALNFTAMVGLPPPASQTFTIENTGGPESTLNWSISYAGTGGSPLPLANLTGGPTSGTLDFGQSEVVTAGVDYTIGPLVPGTYTGTITVFDTLTCVPVETVDITLVVLAAAPLSSLSPTSLTFTAWQGLPAPPSQTFTVTNVGPGGTNLNYTVTDTAAWDAQAPAAGGPLASGAFDTITVTVDHSALAVGTYPDTITVTGAANDPQTVSVTLNVLQPATITRNPATLNFFATEGGPSPAAQTFTITNTGGPSSTLAWGAAEAIAWVTGVSPNAGSLAPAATDTVTVTVDTTALAAGTYTGPITITAPDTSNSPQTVTVNLTVYPRPTIALSPTLLSFTGYLGVAPPPPTTQTFMVTNSGPVGSTLNWNATWTEAWILSVVPSSGSLTDGDSQMVTVTVDHTGKALGNYTATVQVKDTLASNSPQNLTCALSVKSPSQITLLPATLTFTASEGGSAPSPQTFGVTNSGGSGTTLSWTATKSATWISSVSPASGSLATGASATVTVSVNPTGLTVGTYTGSVSVSAPQTPNSPQLVAVRLIVGPKAVISLSPTGLSYGAVIGGGNPASQSFTVSNTGPAGSILAWSATWAETWVQVSPSSGTLASGESQGVQVSVFTAGMTAGSYSAYVSVASGGASNTPQQLLVSLDLASSSGGGGGAGTVGASPTSLAFSGAEGGASPSSQTITISNSGGASTAFAFSATADQPWLSVSPGSGSVSGGSNTAVVATANVTELVAGTYNGVITINAGSASGSPKRIQVTLTVGSSLTSAAAGAPVPDRESTSFTGKPNSKGCNMFAARQAASPSAFVLGGLLALAWLVRGRRD